MNEKTAKLLNKYATTKGLNANNLKKEWMAMNAAERFKRRQALLGELKKGKK